MDGHFIHGASSGLRVHHVVSPESSFKPSVQLPASSPDTDAPTTTLTITQSHPHSLLVDHDIDAIMITHMVRILV